LLAKTKSQIGMIAAVSEHPIQGDERGSMRTSRPGSLFDREIQTYGDSAFGHHI
jgi:hypothetical protein